MFYLHVPKTGGQTLATRLASAFDPDKVHVMQAELVFPGDVKKLTKTEGYRLGPPRNSASGGEGYFAPAME